MGYFSNTGQSLGNSDSTDVALGDLDGDGDLDAFVVNWNNQSNEVWLNRPLQLTGVDSALCTYWGYELSLHGRDHPLEPPQDPEDRIMSWRYQVDYEKDTNNVIKDGGGIDDIDSPTYDYSTNPADPVYIDDNGTWILQVRFGVPFIFLTAGSVDSAVVKYKRDLFVKYNDWDKVDEAFDLTTMQLGNGYTTVIARDATSCAIDQRSQKGKYHYFTSLRVPPVPGPPDGAYRRLCFETFEGEKGQLVLDDFGRESEAFRKDFFLGVRFANGEIYPPP